jgi:hypothetical protein
MTTRAADQRISRLGPEIHQTVQHPQGPGAAPSERVKELWPPMNADERKLKTKFLSAFICVDRRPKLISLRSLTGCPLGPARFKAAFALLALALLARAEIIDRIAVSVGNRVITETDLNREIRVAAFLDGVKPDFSPAGKRATAERMVEQVLIRRELEISRYPVPTAAEVAPVLAAFKKARFPQDEAYQRALAEYGVTDQDVKDLLLWQRTLLLFIEVRFQSGVQVTGQDIQDYFDKVVKPAAEAAHPGQPIDLEDYRDQIEQTLTGQRADRQMDTWLKEARSHTEIVFHDEVLQ